MNDLLKKMLIQLVLPLLVPVLVGIGSAAITGSVMMVRMEERISALEKDFAKHEQSFDKENMRTGSAVESLTRRTDDQESRLSKSETSLEGLRDDVSEIKTDVKSLLRSSKD